MRIAVTGSSGLVGSQLTPFLEGGGHEVIRIVRRTPRNDLEVRWEPERGVLDASSLEGIDAVIHLAGEGIADGRWNEAKKRRILETRVEPTKLLARAMASMSNPPKVLVSASAIGYYGDRGDEPLDETSTVGNSFLADVCAGWELATEPAAQAGVRVVNGRIGIVLTPQGGALKPMLLPFKLGAGGVMGNGRQYWSCISLDDLIGSLTHCVLTDSLHGPVNLVCPEPVTNREFTKTLAKVLRRPAFLPMPAFAVRLLLGEMADALILASTRVTPTRLLDSGYSFRHPTVESALRHVLGATLDVETPSGAS